MKGSLQVCKADLCVKADGDFAKALLAIAFLFVLVFALFSALK